eukprot:COSAG04_NODE_2385_length_4229_cov_1.507748_1_plen_50_part_00
MKLSGFSPICEDGSTPPGGWGGDSVQCENGDPPVFMYFIPITDKVRVCL